MINKELELSREIEHLKSELARVRHNRFWQCPNCNAKRQIKNLYIGKVYFYIHPSGCSDGDYWTTGTSPEYQVFCPNCGLSIRYYPGRTNYDLVKNYAGYFGGEIEINDYTNGNESSYRLIRRLKDNSEYYGVFGSALLSDMVGRYELGIKWKNA